MSSLNNTVKVALGMSGGVDSAVSASLLKEAGYDVTAVFLECYNTPGCRTDADHKDALEVALSLKLPFKVLDFKQAYQEKVIAYFLKEYQSGRTPNPDIACNREIKFGLFYDWAMSEGFDFVATGHYARVERRARGDEQDKRGLESGFQGTSSNQETSALSAPHLALLRGVDETKDQSYFLCQLKPEQLEHVLFPIGHLTKTAVRQIAHEKKLPVANKPDSQGICFIGKISIKEFLKSLGLSEKTGDILFQDKDAKQWKIGHHSGAWFYTVGQRIGLTNRASNTVLLEAGLDPSQLPVLFVLDKHVKNNQLIVGQRNELYVQSFETTRATWLDARSINSHVLVRIRHQGELIGASIQHGSDSEVITLDSSIFGVAPGQIAVFYHQSAVVGWATIKNSL